MVGPIVDCTMYKIIYENPLKSIRFKAFDPRACDHHLNGAISLKIFKCSLSQTGEMDVFTLKKKDFFASILLSFYN